MHFYYFRYTEKPQPWWLQNGRCHLKIIDLEDGLKKDIEKLVDLKKEIMGVIHTVPNVEYQMLLEKRYLCFIT